MDGEYLQPGQTVEDHLLPPPFFINQQVDLPKKMSRNVIHLLVRSQMISLLGIYSKQDSGLRSQNRNDLFRIRFRLPFITECTEL